MIPYKKIVFKNFINLSLNQGFNIIATIIYTPIIFQKLGSENFGQIHLAFSILILLSIITSYGYNFNGSVKIAESENSFEEKSVISEILFLRLSLCFFVFLISIPIINTFFDENFSKILIFSFSILLSEAINPMFLFQGRNNLFSLAIINFFSKSVYILFIVCFISGSNDDYLVNFFYGISIFLFFFFYWIYYEIRSRLIKIKFSFKKLILNLKDNFQLFLSSVSSHITINSIIIILSFFESNKVLGEFTIAFKVAFILRMIPVFYFQSSLQKATSLNIISKSKFDNFVTKTFYLGLLVTLLISFLTFIFSSELVILFAGEKVNYSAHILTILSIIPFLAMLNVKNVIIILINDYKDVLNKATFYTLIFMLTFSLLFTNLYGGVGLAYSLLFTEIFAFFINYILLNKRNE